MTLTLTLTPTQRNLFGSAISALELRMFQQQQEAVPVAIMISCRINQGADEKSADLQPKVCSVLGWRRGH